MEILYTILLHFILVELQMRITTLVNTFQPRETLSRRSMCTVSGLQTHAWKLWDYKLCVCVCVFNSIKRRFPRWLSGKESICQCQRHRRCGFDPWVRKIPWRREWQPTLVFLLEDPMDRGAWRLTVHGDYKELDMTDWLSMHTCVTSIWSGRRGRLTTIWCLTTWGQRE